MRISKGKFPETSISIEIFIMQTIQPKIRGKFRRKIEWKGKLPEVNSQLATLSSLWIYWEAVKLVWKWSVIQTGIFGGMDSVLRSVTDES